MITIVAFHCSASQARSSADPFSIVLSLVVELQLHESQCGFRKGRGCADQLLSLRIMMEKAREYSGPLFMCFIDLKKAYDKVDRNALVLPWKLISIT